MSTGLQVRCESCSQVIDVADLNLERMLARCGPCNLLFDFSAQVTAAQPKQTRPSGVVRQQRGAQVIVSWRWFELSVLFLTFFCIAWDSFLIFWYSTALRMPQTPWLMLIFPIGHLFIGVTMTYQVLCTYLNRTQIQFDRSQVEVAHGPLPSPNHKSLRVKAGDIEQVFVVENRNSKGPHTYAVHALLKNGSRTKLLDALALERALYLSQEIVGHLGLIQRPVPGEYRT